MERTTIRDLAFKAARLALPVLAMLAISACALTPQRPMVKVTTIAPPRSAAQAANDVAYQAAVRAIQNRDYGLALDLLQTARSQGAHDIRVLNAFGVVYDELGRFDLSARYYAEAEAIDRNSTIVISNLAYSQKLQGLARNAPAPVAMAAAEPAPAQPAVAAPAVTPPAATPPAAIRSAQTTPAPAAREAVIAPTLARSAAAEVLPVPPAPIQAAVTAPALTSPAAIQAAQTAPAPATVAAVLAPTQARLAATEALPVLPAPVPHAPAQLAASPGAATWLAAAKPTQAARAYGEDAVFLALDHQRLARTHIPSVIQLTAGAGISSARPFDVIDASGQSSSAEALRLGLVRLGWSPSRTARHQQRLVARTTIRFAPAKLATAQALARTLPGRAVMAACARDCQGVRLIVGTDAVNWKFAARARHS